MSVTAPLALLAAQLLSSFFAFGLLAQRLSRQLRTWPEGRALEALVWPHAFRYIPLGLLAPGQASHEIPRNVLGTIALGDFSSALFALTALTLLAARAKAARSAVWVFSLVSSVDIALALGVGLGHHVYRYPLGMGWFVLTMYVPLVCISQWLIFARLRQERRALAPSGAHLFTQEHP